MNGQAMAAGDGGLRLDDRYQLITQVGSGGMSVVWRAQDEVLGRDVAVKLLTPSLAGDPAFSRRLLAEARAVSALVHAHITLVHDFGVHRAADGQWTPYLVMELLNGELLSEALRRGPLPWRQAVTICAQLASALQAAHEHGIVHRDVTPANIMLTGTGVKVLDFGISALIGDKQLGADGEVLGTAAYLAPERLLRGRTTAAADVYAAGLVLYQCLVGHLPWPAQSTTEMLYAHAHIPPHPLPPLGLPHAVEEVCYQTLAREPHHRPTSAELAQTLTREVRRINVAAARFQVGPTRVLAGGDTVTVALKADRARRRRFALIGGAALIAVIATAAFSQPGIWPDRANVQAGLVAATSTGPAKPAITTPPGIPAHADPRPVPAITGWGIPINTLGGIVHVLCKGSHVQVLTVAPATGYTIKDSDPGPAAEVQVVLLSTTNETELKIRCGHGQPIPNIKDSPQ